MKKKYIVFDLDDTLINEIDYLKSAFKSIVSDLRQPEEYNIMLDLYFSENDPFEYIQEKYSIKKEILICNYRKHFPIIELKEDAAYVLSYIKNKKHKLGLISDGRSLTQRNKLKALGIESLFDLVIISEEFGTAKPCKKNYEVFVDENIKDYFYIADNVSKDFIAPNQLGWTTICLLDKGQNIHKQNFNIQKDYLPKYIISELKELVEYIN